MNKRPAVRWAGLLLLVSVASALLPAESKAGHWMYRPSYFTGRPPQADNRAVPRPLPRSRSAYRPALVGSGIGFAARGGYRYNRIFLRSGRSTDITVIREDWVDLKPWP